MSYEFKEDHLRSLYKFLGHDGAFSRVGSCDYSKTVVKNGREVPLYEEELVQGEEEVVNYAKRYNGERNIFISRSGRNSDGTVRHSRVLSFDIDPIRTRGTAATEQQRLNAVSAGRRICSIYPGGYIASSGNGCLLLYHSGDFVSSLPDYYRREAVLIKEFQELVDDLNVKIDSTNYDAAIIKAIGSFSTKGTPELRICSSWVDNPVPPYANCEGLLARLADIKGYTQTLPKLDISKLHSAFNGDRSTADYNLVRYLKRSGVSRVDALVALRSNPLGRQTDEKDQARLISKIYGKDEEEKRSTDYFSQLFEADDLGSFKTGFATLDEIMGPLPNGEITLFAARSGFGKTTFMCSVASRTKKKVLYFCTEMAGKYIYAKLLAIKTKIGFKAIAENQVSQEDRERFKECKAELDHIVIDDEDRPTVEYVYNKILEHNPDLVVLDHINHIHDNWEDVSNYTKMLKEKIKDDNFPVVLLAQLNEPPRDYQTGEEMPSLRSDIQSKNKLINICARIVLMTNTFKAKGRYQPVIFDIQKDRFGGPGGTVTLYCDKDVSSYVDEKEETNGSSVS